MKKKKFVMLTSAFLSLIILSSSMISVFAYDVTEDFVATEEFLDTRLNDINDKTINLKEQKYTCNATIDDDFEDDSVLVMFNHETSLELKKYTPNDFYKLGVVQVNDITADTVNEIKEQRADSISYVNKYSDSAETYNIDESKFNQVILLKLNACNKQNVLDTVKKLEKRDDVLIAQPNYTYTLDSVTANDARVNEQWAINKINLPNAWSQTTGNKSIKVGILDSGIHRAHADLNNNVSKNLGYSFFDNQPYVDKDGHGTLIAGIIGAVSNNSIGVAGVCWNIEMVSLKIFSYDKNNELKTSSSAIKGAIEYAKNNNIDILNFSYGGYVYDTIEYNAMANYNGIIICSAGNNTNNNDTKAHYPSDYKLDNVISVAASDKNDRLAAFSNYGKTSVDLAAPGAEILSTYIGSTSDLYFYSDSGTSFAAPYVTGVAALLMSKYPKIQVSRIRSAILNSVDKVSALSNKVATGGRLNAYKTLQTVANHKYTIKYNSNGGTGSMSNTVVTYGVNTELRSNTFSAPNSTSTFNGWYAHRSSDNKWFYKGSNGEGWYEEGKQPSGYTKYLYKNKAVVAYTSHTNGDTVTMYAQWRPNKYNIIFNSNGGVGGMSSQVVTYYQTISLNKNNFVRGGYNFTGWYAKRNSDSKWYYTNGTSSAWYKEGSQPTGYSKYLFGNMSNVSYLSNIEGDIIYMYAQWSPMTYRITFNKNGGTGTMNSISAKSNQVISLPLIKFTRQNYCFNGWNVMDEDEFWYYTNGSKSEWYIEVNAPKDYKKVKYYDGDNFSYIADYNNIGLTMYAQWVAKNNIMLGDVNLDGKVTVDDVTCLQKYLVKSSKLTEAQLFAADYNKDGKVDATDVTAIQKSIVS